MRSTAVSVNIRSLIGLGDFNEVEVPGFRSHIKLAVAWYQVSIRRVHPLHINVSFPAPPRCGTAHPITLVRSPGKVPDIPMFTVPSPCV